VTLVVGLAAALVRVAADIIRTVAVQPSLQNVAVLELIVLIRRFLSFSLEVEIDGRWPWRRAVLGRAAPSPASPGSSEPGGWWADRLAISQVQGLPGPPGPDHHRTVGSLTMIPPAGRGGRSWTRWT
jgi:hypothetical protein